MDRTGTMMKCQIIKDPAWYPGESIVMSVYTTDINSTECLIVDQ